MTKKSISLSFIATLLAVIILTGCGKDNGDPVIRFEKGPGLVAKDTVLKVNDSILIKVAAEWNGFDLLNLFEIRLNGEKVNSLSLKDEAAVLSVPLIKSTLETEVWEFVISDKRGNSATVGLALTKDPNSEFGGVVQISPIVLGAQKSSTIPGLISFQTNQTFTLEQAFPNQGKIDMLFYSQTETQATLASPGSDIPESVFTGSRNPILWTTRNLTRFLKLEYTEAEFIKVTNDVPILNYWSDAQSVTKAGNLKQGDVYLFRLQSGKKGILLVKSILAGDTGQINFSVKIQD